MRFVYKPMSAGAFLRALDAAGIGPSQFADGFSLPYPDDADQWAAAGRDIPRWVPVASALASLPGALNADDELRPLAEVLKTLGMDTHALARLIGANSQTVQRWRTGKQDIPPYLPRLLALLQLPGGLGLAREVAARFIIEDKERPGTGPAPFLAARRHRTV